jgi:hypothetical protein
MEYSENIQQQALNLYMDHTPLSAVAEMDDMPSRATLYNWKSDGVLTDGVDWKEYREEVEANSLRRAAKGSDSDFWQTFETTAREALISAVERIRDGKTSVRGSDLNQIASALTKREQLDTADHSAVDREEAVTAFLSVLRAHVDSNLFREIADSMKEDLTLYLEGEKSLEDLQHEAGERGVIAAA